MQRSNYNPTPEQEQIWDAEKRRLYDLWRETKLSAAVEWLESAPTAAEQSRRAIQVRDKFGKAFAGALEARMIGGGS